MELRNRAETDEVLEIANDIACEYNGGMSLEFSRIRELLMAEKELSKARGMLASWEIFRQGISEKYPELLKWCPPVTITIHDPEFPDVVIFDSVIFDSVIIDSVKI